MQVCHTSAYSPVKARFKEDGPPQWLAPESERSRSEGRMFQVGHLAYIVLPLQVLHWQ